MLPRLSNRKGQRVKNAVSANGGACGLPSNFDLRAR